MRFLICCLFSFFVVGTCYASTLTDLVRDTTDEVDRVLVSHPELMPYEKQIVSQSINELMKLTSHNKGIGDAVIGGVVSGVVGAIVDHVITHMEHSTPTPPEHHEAPEHHEPPEHHDMAPPAPCPRPGQGD